MKAIPEQILDAVVAEVRPIILTAFRKDSCIVSSRIGQEVLAYFGVKAEARACIVQAMNPGCWAAYERGEEPDWPGGDWGVVIGKPGEPEEPGRVNYHVALEVEGGFLLDLSIDQASRPHKGIPLEPFWAPIIGDLHNGHTHVLERDDGCVITYRLLDRDFSQAPDWKDRARRKPLVGQAIRQVRSRLEVHYKDSCQWPEPSVPSPA